MAALKIVRRNTKAVSRKRRVHELAGGGGRRLYVVEELVAQGDQKRWAQFIAMEVISGGIAAPGSALQNSVNSGHLHPYKLLV